MLGSIEEAIIISQWEYDEDGHNEWIAPGGFDVLGDGADRVAFLSHRTNVVYKREFDNNGSNRKEFINFLRIKSIPCKGWRIPETSLIELVCHSIIAMEYIPGYMDEQCARAYDRWSRECNCGQPAGICTAGEWEKPRSIWQIDDINLGNIVVVDDGSRYLVDLAD